MAGKVALRCPVCRVVVNALAKDLPQYIKESESELIPILEDVCRGPEDTSIPSILGIAPPPLPPAWAHDYAVQMPASAAHRGAGKTIDGLDGWSLRERKKKSNTRKKKSKQSNKNSNDLVRAQARPTAADHLEKIILVETCKLAIHTHEDIIATHIRNGAPDRWCNHVCNPDVPVSASEL